jgi:hypothetical protein
LVTVQPYPLYRRSVDTAHSALTAANVDFGCAAGSNFECALAAAATARDASLDGLLLLTDGGHPAENRRA